MCQATELGCKIGDFPGENGGAPRGEKKACEPREYGRITFEADHPPVILNAVKNPVRASWHDAQAKVQMDSSLGSE